MELLDSISTESDRLGRLIANLPDRTRFESGGVRLTRDACPLEEIAGAALHRLESQLRDREVEVKLPDYLPLVFVDEVLVGHVFVNILENALKYTPLKSPIEITAHAQATTVTVEIRDHGVGFEPGEEDRIFDKFYRSKPAASRGAGRGLAIAKAVVEAHGGHIGASNHPQGGAVFRFDLPAQSLRVEQPA
jgi:two-component system sensor histidine kinase KdpD